MADTRDLSLIERLEKATGGSLVLDAEIWCAAWDYQFVRWDGAGCVCLAAEQTRMLLPPGTFWAVGCMEEGPFARLCVPREGRAHRYIEVTAATVELALAAAALRARTP